MLSTEISNCPICMDELVRLIDNAAGAMYISDAQPPFRFRLIGGRIRTVCGKEPEDFTSGRVLRNDLIVERDRQRVIRTLEEAYENRIGYRLEYTIDTDLGERVLLDRAEPYINDNSDIVAWYGVISDITDRKNAERELGRTQMLQSLGKLTAGIAHEINTPIQFIGDNNCFLRDSLDSLLDLYVKYRRLKDCVKSGNHPDLLADEISKIEDKCDIKFLLSEIPKALDQTAEGISRISSMVQAMRAFSHLDERRTAPADINRAIQNCATISRNETKYIAELKLELDENLPRVVCSIDEISRVLLNLITNAAQSIAEDPHREQNSKGLITVTTKLLDEDRVEIRVCDTGPGIPEEIRHRVFEPFFTTKTASKGTGQGLSISRSIITEKHGGQLCFDTEIGKGTSFRVILPVNGGGNAGR